MQHRERRVAPDSRATRRCCRGAVGPLCSRVAPLASGKKPLPNGRLFHLFRLAPNSRSRGFLLRGIGETSRAEIHSSGSKNAGPTSHGPESPNLGYGSPPPHAGAGGCVADARTCSLQDLRASGCPHNRAAVDQRADHCRRADSRSQRQLWRPSHNRPVLDVRNSGRSRHSFRTRVHSVWGAGRDLDACVTPSR